LTDFPTVFKIDSGRKIFHFSGNEQEGLAGLGNFLKGGSLELSQQLEAEAKRDKPRFAALALQMKADIQPVYFEALLRGLLASDKSQNDQTTAKAEICQSKHPTQWRRFGTFMSYSARKRVVGFPTQSQN
jgi:hypothetical protein